MGKAEVLQLQDGKRVLRLTELETYNGPDVQLYLVAAPDATDNASITNAGFISLGPLKGNKGGPELRSPWNCRIFEVWRRHDLVPPFRSQLRHRSAETRRKQ
jgi:Electron transfer DM13